MKTKPNHRLHLLWMLFISAWFLLGAWMFMRQTTEMIHVMRTFRFQYTSHNDITAGCVNFPPGKSWWDAAALNLGSATEDPK